jgi:hypothetical protein
VLGTRLFVFGGEAPSGTFGQVEVYDAATSRWTALAPMPTPRHGLTAIALDGRIHVLSGGPQPGGSYSSAHEVLSPRSTVDAGGCARGRRMGSGQDAVGGGDAAAPVATVRMTRFRSPIRA